MNVPRRAREGDVEKAALLVEGVLLWLRHRDLQNGVILDLAGEAPPTAHHVHQQNVVSLGKH